MHDNSIPSVDVPAIDIDPGAIRSAAQPLAPLNLDVQDHARTLLNTWHGGEPYYQAPETAQLMAAIDPVGPIALRVGERLSEASRVLVAYADTVDPIIAELNRLRSMSAPTTAQEAIDRISQVRRLLAELAAAESVCLRALRALASNPGFDPRPKKVAIGDETQKTEVGIKLGVVKVGANAAFVVTRFSDGSEIWTFTDARTVGATIGVGSSLALGNSGVGAKIEVAPGITLGVGDSWRIDDADEAARMRDTVNQIIYRELLAYDPDTAQGVAVADAIRPNVLPPPDLVTTDVKFDATVTGKLGPNDTGVLDATLSLAGGGSYKTTIATDNADGSTITTTTTDLTGTFGGRFDAGSNNPYGGVGTEQTDTRTGAIAVTKDIDGHTTKVILTMTEEGADKSGAKGGTAGTKAGFDGTGSHLTTTTVALDVNDRNRELVDQAIAGRGVEVVGTMRSPATFYPDRAVPGDAFQNLLHSDATVTRVDSDKVTAKFGVDGQVSDGLTIGANAGIEHSASGSVRARYLDLPDADGVRHEVDVPQGIDTRPNPVLGPAGDDGRSGRRGAGGTF